MVFHCSLCNCKSPHVSRILLNILTDLNNGVVWTVSTRPIISMFFNPYSNPLVTVPRAALTIGIIVTFMFHSFLNYLARLKFLSLFWHSFNSGLPGLQSPQSCKSSLFLLIIMRSGHLAKIRWSVCISKPQRSLCVSFSWTDSLLCIYHLSKWLNFNFSHNSQWITLPTQTCLVLSSFCANLLHLLIIIIIIIILLLVSFSHQC